MKRNTNRRESASRSATFETLENRQMFCFGPWGSFAMQPIDTQETAQTAELRGGSDFAIAQKVAGTTQVSTHDVQS